MSEWQGRTVHDLGGQNELEVACRRNMPEITLARASYGRLRGISLARFLRLAQFRTYTKYASLLG